VAEDQAARRKWMSSHGETGQMIDCDRENSTWLRGILRDFGWPGVSMVGTDGGVSAWVLAQHADHDPVFQCQCLDLLIEAADMGEAPRWQVAYLTDRVDLKRRRPQRYGTQYRREGSSLVPYPCQEPESLPRRRATMDLPPAEY
jgi:hypothetical protein